MSHAAYVGILTPGTTSRMRADSLEAVAGSHHWTRFNTDQLFLKASKPIRSIAFRWKRGPLIQRINQSLIAALDKDWYELIWVDKGIYLTPETTRQLRRKAAKMVHYTPDSAFLANRSYLFERSVEYYDLLVTTKSFEKVHYQAMVEDKKIHLTTQSFDSHLHRVDWNEAKDPVVAFVGLYEQDRDDCLQLLLDAGIPVRLAGQGWEKFVSRNKGNRLLDYRGARVFGDEYRKFYASSAVGLGLLSRKFPELHTTRTFEIPRCGTVLATERNQETAAIFSDEDVLFFNDYTDLVDRLKAILDSPAELDARARNGFNRVSDGGFDNHSVIARILAELETTE